MNCLCFSNLASWVPELHFFGGTEVFGDDDSGSEGACLQVRDD
jgi:hypothetical protein